jgi:hypothetical protein
MLAVAQMSPAARTVFYAIALVLFLAGAFGLDDDRSPVSLTSLGLAVFVVPALWDSWSLT